MHFLWYIYNGRLYDNRKKLTLWQQPLLCGNRYVPQMNFQITAKCNYNCVHCFNAADNSPLCAEMPYEDVLSLLDEARACGINAITITGGEPMMHRHFMEIMHAIYERGMFVFDFNTNGYFLRQETLEEFRAMGCEPRMKISFDGIRYHDWMRGRHGAEADALRLRSSGRRREILLHRTRSSVSFMKTAIMKNSSTPCRAGQI